MMARRRPISSIAIVLLAVMPFALPSWGSADPAYLGISCEKNPRGKGVLVTDVVSGSPAEGAGVAKGDIIETVEGKAINGPDDLRSVVGSKSPGDAVTVAGQRSGKPLKLSIKLGRRPPTGDAAPPTGKDAIPAYLARQEKKLQASLDRMEKGERTTFESLLRKAREATVRIRIGTGGGTGVLINGGKLVITVGHNLRGEVGVGGTFATILTDGRQFKSRVLTCSYKDGEWSVRKRVPDLVIAEVINPKEESLPSIVLGDPEKDGLAVLLGYPLMHARKNDGTIFWIPAQDLGGYASLAIPSKVLGRDPGVADILVLDIDPVETLEGASGGPVINRKGEIIGLIRAGDGETVSLTHVDTIRRFLKELPSGK